MLYTLILRAITLHVELRAYALTRRLVPHAFCIVKLLLCLCIVASPSSCCSWFNCQVEIIEQYMKYHYCLVKVVYVVKFSLMNYMLIIIECEISPLLFECCFYVGNVQITRISCWCALTSLVRRLRVALIRNGMGILAMFSTVAYYFWTMLLNLWN